jgi:hypothetical protein
VVSILLLVLNQSAFRHGPGVPTAGTTEAWNLVWLCLGLVVLGHVVSLPTSLVWAAARVRRRQRLGTALALVLAYDAIVALLLLVWFIFG